MCLINKTKNHNSRITERFKEPACLSLSLSLFIFSFISSKLLHHTDMAANDRNEGEVRWNDWREEKKKASQKVTRKFRLLYLLGVLFQWVNDLKCDFIAEIHLNF